MTILAQLAFLLILGAASWLFARNISLIRKTILLGKDESLNDQPQARWKNVLLLAFGQKKMFRNVPVAVMHFIIYAGFTFIYR